MLNLNQLHCEKSEIETETETNNNPWLLFEQQHTLFIISMVQVVRYEMLDSRSQTRSWTEKECKLSINITKYPRSILLGSGKRISRYRRGRVRAEV